MFQPVSETTQLKIVQLIATELGVKPQQVAAAIAPLDEGATVPFIARYRKEATGNLDDTHLRSLEECLFYLRELEERRVGYVTGSPNPYVLQRVSRDPAERWRWRLRS